MSATLHSLIENGYGLRVFCSKCQHCAELDVAALAERCDGDTTLHEIGRRTRCNECGGKGGEVQVVAVT